MAYFIGRDVGGTHCRMKAADGAGKVLGTFEGPGCSLNTDAETVCRSATAARFCLRSGRVAGTDFRNGLHLLWKECGWGNCPLRRLESCDKR